ncbi:MBL fold metallo-hydrolase [Paenibacillus apii]|uniref:MBL fold metallo-hydrolase n=1 Tax=Paenibacillus apii TaxID=1850370 RepID=UPI0014393E11|nr:MBL fold metallo-hydrolase [Paenibacillus apii]NJJ39044.1 MBL fold metallo-hydrolase [Paenibacillus apii]
MQIAQGIEMLEITAEVMGGTDTLYPALLWDEDHAVLVDTGYPGLLDKIKKAFELAGVAWSTLDTVVLTHQDIDHIGGLPSILDEANGTIKVLTHPIEQPYIEGERMLLKHTPEAIAAAEAMLPPHVPEEWRRAFLHLLAHPPKAKVDAVIEDGQKLPVAGGVIVVETPGHSPGHVSLYHPASRTLIAADSLTVKNGELHGPDPRVTPDMATALSSLRKYADYAVENVICYHGGLYRGDAGRRIAELAEGAQ